MLAIYTLAESYTVGGVDSTIQYNYLYYNDKKYMCTNDVVQMLCKPPSHTGLICHFIHKVQDKLN